MTEPSREPSPWPGPAYPATPPSGAAWPTAPQRNAPTALAIASIVLAIALTVVEVATALASGPAANDFGDALRDGRSTYDVVTWYDGLELLLFPVMLAAYVVSCLWLQFARSNTATINPHGDHQRGRIWVWLGWWVPFVAFWFPYQVVRDVQDNSDRGGPVRSLGLWWAAWLVYIVGNRFTARASTSADLSTVEALPIFETITAIAVIVACVQWCRIVHAITNNQRTALSPR